VALYDVVGGNTAYSTDLDQLVDALTGKNDVTLTAFVPLAVPGAPTVAVNTTAGNLTGNYQYAVAFVTGYWQGPAGTGTIHVQGNTGGGTASAIVAPSAQQVNLSAIPIGPTGVVQRVLYRTDANGSAFYYLVTLDDNTTTTYTDNTPDASLGAAMPATNTTGTVANLWKLNVSGLATFNAGLTLPSGQTLTNNGTYAGSPLVTSLTATNGLSVSNPASPGAASYSLVLNGTSLSNSASGLSLNLGNPNVWTAAQTFNASAVIPGGQSLFINEAGDYNHRIFETALNSNIVEWWEFGTINFRAGGNAAVTSSTPAVSITAGRVSAVVSVPTFGNFGVATVVAYAYETELTGTGGVNVCVFAPTTNGLFEVSAYFRVVTGTTTVNIYAYYTDATATVQTIQLLPSTSEAVGDYSCLSVTLGATTGGPLVLVAQASVANQVFVSGSIIAM
jgi:hypothetical protein